MTIHVQPRTVEDRQTHYYLRTAEEAGVRYGLPETRRDVHIPVPKE